MSKSKIITRWDSDKYGESVLLLERKRGSITVKEIQDLLLYEGGSRFHGSYAIILHATGDMCAPPSMFEEDDTRDYVELYPLHPGEDCPVCRKTLVMDICPECGSQLTQ